LLRKSDSLDKGLITQPECLVTVTFLSRHALRRKPKQREASQLDATIRSPDAIAIKMSSLQRVGFVEIKNWLFCLIKLAISSNGKHVGELSSDFGNRQFCGRWKRFTYVRLRIEPVDNSQLGVLQSFPLCRGFRCSNLLHGQETDVWGDSAYQGQSEVIKGKAPKARERTNKGAKRKVCVNQTEQARNRRKSRVCARVEQVIGVIKRVFGFSKVYYRGLEKNANRLFATGGLTNLYILRRRLRTA
jgi:hypothetical protein